MDFRKYIASTTYPSDLVLEDWRWLIGTALQLWHATKFGDALLLNPEDGSIYFLDVMAGKVERIAENEAEFESALATNDNANKWLMTDVMDGQALLGMLPGHNECLSFKHPPALGGQLDPDNFETCDIAVHLSIAGQIHRQCKDLPPGTKISNTNFESTERKISKRPWWRFW